MTKDLIVDWPDSVAMPALPDGYEWVGLWQAGGLNLPDGGHPWYIRLCWTIKGGKKRMLSTGMKVFATPQEAINYAHREATQHQKRRAAL